MVELAGIELLLHEHLIDEGGLPTAWLANDNQGEVW